MKTSATIEAQEERKAARDNGNDPRSSPANSPPVRQKLKQRDATRIAAWRWPPGQSGNPSGRPKHDLAAEIAKAIFENNPELIYKAYAKAVAKGNAYAYQVLAERAYGKLKESIQHETGRRAVQAHDGCNDSCSKRETSFRWSNEEKRGGSLDFVPPPYCGLSQLRDRPVALHWLGG